MPKSSKHINYYEAIIQLRPDHKEIREFIYRQLEKRGEWISREVPLKTGLDLYASSQRTSRSLAPRIKKMFKAEIKVTRKLVTQEKMSGKKLYRATVLIRT